MVKTRNKKNKTTRRFNLNGSTEPVKLDLSVGELPPDFAFKRHNFDPTKYPWPLKSGTVAEVFSAFLLNRIPGMERLNFMDELYRVLVDGGKATIVVPYWTSPRSIQDPHAAWPPLCEQSFLYYNKGWREQQKIDVKCDCDFDFTYGYALEQETAGRNDETRAHWIKHYTNSVNDLQVTLTKRP